MTISILKITYLKLYITIWSYVCLELQMFVQQAAQILRGVAMERYLQAALQT